MLRCAFLCCAVLCEGSLFATGGQLLGLQVFVGEAGSLHQRH